MIKKNDKVIIPLKEDFYPCWNYESYTGPKKNKAIGLCIWSSDEEFRVEYSTKEYGKVAWTFWQEERILFSKVTADTYPKLLSDKFNVVYKVKAKYGSFSPDDEVKAKEEAMSFVRRNYREWPLGHDLNSVLSEEDGAQFIEFFFQPSENL